MDTAYWDDCAWLCPRCEAERDEGELPAILELVESGDPGWDVDGDELRDESGDLNVEKWLAKKHTEPIVYCIECETTYDVEFNPR